eukprot:m.1144845 g.1144845  ORF g.1144845 m.1144845 type:complete len:676 (+) comp24464_c0_seq12:41-2068(+)
MMHVPLLLAGVFAVASAGPIHDVISLNLTAVATTCAACVSADQVWCYHDGVCYPHGSKADTQPFSCPGSDRCASNKNCKCTSCDDKTCQPKVPNAESCHGWTCNVNGQYCPPQVPGATAPNGDCCVGGTWVPGVCGTPQPGAVTGPAQVHLALGKDPGTMTVSWASNSTTTVTPVRYHCISADCKDQTPHTAYGDSRPLNVAGYRVTHVATLEHLVEGERYTYAIDTYNKSFSFTYRTQHVEGRPDVHIIFGDMGASHAFSLCLACTAGSATCDEHVCATNATDKGLIAETDADMFLHVGDFAYNFDSDGGSLGDMFMQNIEQVASKVPYMVSHGNHEDSDSNLAHFIERFRGMPSNAVPANVTTLAGETTNTLYYSWDAGLVHYIAISTELWFGVGTKDVNLASFKEWLKKDLEAANQNRENVPWVVAHGHRDIYCSTTDDDDCNTLGDAGLVRAVLEPLFFEYGVDIWINGHEHSYERTYPLYQGKSVASYVNPPCTFYIVTGAAGSPEMHEGFDNKQPSWSAFRSNTFGYSRMSVFNSTHLYWEQVQTDPTLFPTSDYGRVIDSVWVTQENHGPFDPKRAPNSTAWPVGDETPSRTDDHWEPLLKQFGVDDGSDRAMSAIIRDYKAKHGHKAWAEVEDKLLTYANGFLGGGLTYEDVRGDGASSGDWFRWKA